MRVLYFIVAFIILLSGCVGPEGTPPISTQMSSGTAGVVVEKFMAVPNEIYDDQKAVLLIKLKNSGESDATNGYIKIYGYDPNEMEVQPSEEYFTLEGADRALGLGGKEISKSFSLTVKKPLPYKQTFSYPIFARICYTYTTHAFGKVEIISEDEYLRRAMNNEISQHPIQVENTNAPVMVYVEQTHPIVASSKELVFKLRIENIGPGYVGPCSAAFEERNRITEVTVSLGGVTCTSQKGVYLERGKSEEIVVSCGIPSSSVPVGTSDLRIDLTYPYYQDVETVLTVEGRGEGG